MARKTFKKIVVTEERLKEVEPKNLRLAEKFLKNKSTRSSQKTIENYQSDLNIFFVWNLLENDNVLFPHIKKLQLSEFFYWCSEELKWGSARTRRMRSVLSSFSKFIEMFYDEEYPGFRNIVLIAIESAPKSPRREKTILKDEQIEEIIQWAREEDPQIACWLALGISSGARFSELLRFESDLIDETHVAFDGLFLETTRKIRTKGRGVEGKMLKKYIIKDLFLYDFNKWMEIRSGMLKEDHNSLFIRKDGTPARDGTVRSWISRIEKQFEIDFYPHALRHYFTTYLSKVGLPAQLIQEIGGWETADMVGVYDDTDVKDKKWEELNNLRQKLSE